MKGHAFQACRMGPPKTPALAAEVLRGLKAHSFISMLAVRLKPCPFTSYSNTGTSTSGHRALPATPAP